MYAVRGLSLNNGWHILSNDKPDEWQDIKNALLELTPELMLKPSTVLSTKNSRINDDVAYIYLSSVWSSILQKYSWEESYNFPKQEGGNVFRLDNVKNLVSSNILGASFIEGDELSKIIFIEGPRSLSMGICDVTIVLVPVDSIKNLYRLSDKEVTFPVMLTESSCRINLNELFPIQSSSPIVILFFSTDEEPFVLDEIPSIQQEGVINRSIEFEPEYYQAGVGVLSYFGEVLRQKYPDVNAKVRIEQDGSTVRMHIELPTGDIDTIERELEKYALVISNQLAPEVLFENKAHIMRLEHKLEVTKLEVKQANDMLQLTRDLTSQRVNNLEQEVSTLRQQIGTQLLQTGQIISLANHQVASHEKVQLAQIGHTQSLFKNIIGEAHGNKVLQNAIRSLEYNLMSGIATIEVQDQIRDSLSTIKDANPSLLARVAAQIEGAGYGVILPVVLDLARQHLQ
jgi:hypothetical protein